MKNFEIIINGQCPNHVSAKDLVLAVIREIGTAGGTGYAIEFKGEAIEALSIEGRMTVCNMAIEAGARCGLIAVDEKTINYFQDKPFSPKGENWEKAAAYWRTLKSDQDAKFDRTLTIDASTLKPQVTWGTSPEMVVDVNGSVPDPASEQDPVKKSHMHTALSYMGLEPNTPMGQITIDKVFIGSCTNARIEDLRMAAMVLKGKKIASSIQLAIVVPGSGLVKDQAEEEGLDKIFTDAGFEWRNPGCSMCLGMNPDKLSNQERCISTSNRNFEGRQGPGGRTHLASPYIAACSAIAGTFSQDQG